MPLNWPLCRSRSNRRVGDYFIRHRLRRSSGIERMRELAHERKVDVSGAVSGAVVVNRATKTKQDTDILGGPGRTRTCNQTVMSGRILVAFVDFAVLRFDFDRVRCASMASFLVRIWCGGAVRRSEDERSLLTRRSCRGCAGRVQFGRREEPGRTVPMDVIMSGIVDSGRDVAKSTRPTLKRHRALLDFGFDPERNSGAKEPTVATARCNFAHEPSILLLLRRRRRVFATTGILSLIPPRN